MINKTAAHYDSTTIALHWMTALLIIILWVSGQIADWVPKGPVRTGVWSSHGCLGFLVTIVVVWRVMWRATKGRRLPPADVGPRQLTAKATHHLLYALLAVVIVLGISNAFVRGYSLFSIANLPQVGDKAWRKPLTHWHGTVANVLLALALFHAGAALAHHYLWKDGVLRRMVPGRGRLPRSTV